MILEDWGNQFGFTQSRTRHHHRRRTRWLRVGHHLLQLLRGPVRLRQADVRRLPPARILGGRDLRGHTGLWRTAVREYREGRRFWCLNLGMWLFALGNGTCEAVINPLTATLFPRNKTHWLNILHAGWPGGLILGVGDHARVRTARRNDPLGVQARRVPDPGADLRAPDVRPPVPAVGGQDRRRAGDGDDEDGRHARLHTRCGPDRSVRWPHSCPSVFGRTRQWIGWVAAGVSGWPSGSLRTSPSDTGCSRSSTCCTPLVGYVELGTDSWITNITEQVLQERHERPSWRSSGPTCLMFTLRFFAGPIVHKINPIGLLFASAVAGHDRPLPARQSDGRYGVAVDRRRDDLRNRQDVLLADAARGDLGAIPEGRGAGARA